MVAGNGPSLRRHRNNLSALLLGGLPGCYGCARHGSIVALGGAVFRIIGFVSRSSFPSLPSSLSLRARVGRLAVEGAHGEGDPDVVAADALVKRSQFLGCPPVVSGPCSSLSKDARRDGVDDRRDGRREAVDDFLREDAQRFDGRRRTPRGRRRRILRRVG